MKQGGGAVEECDEGKRQAGVAVGSAPKLCGKPAFDEFEGRHVFFTSERNSPIFRDEAIVVGMGNEEIESAAASFQRRARGPDGMRIARTHEERCSNLAQPSATEKIL